MNKNKADRIIANIRYTGNYFCAACGKAERGMIVSCTIEARSIKAVKEQLDALKLNPQSMPYGWSYNGEFNCGCKYDPAKA